MYTIGIYKGSDKMSDLICEKESMLLIISRFGIPLGVGEQSIQEVCESNQVCTDAFLATVNLLTNDDYLITGQPTDIIYIRTIVKYLQQSHTYFLDFKLPSIRKNLVEALSFQKNKISNIIIQYFDDYIAEVQKHMSYEEATLFPYIENLLAQKPTNYSIATFQQQHNAIDQVLFELKNIIIKYYEAESTNALNEVLFSIFSCANELLSHNKVEDSLLVPVIENLEKTK